MARDHFGLSSRKGRLLGEHCFGDRAMQVAPALLEQRFVRRILNQRMMEGDYNGVILATLLREAGAAQAPQASFDVAVIRSHRSHPGGGKRTPIQRIRRVPPSGGGVENSARQLLHE